MASFADPNDKDLRAEEDEENVEGVGFVTVRSCVATIIKLLAIKGYKMKPNISGQWCGFDVYVEQVIDIPGIECDAKLLKIMPEYMGEVFVEAVEAIVTNELAGVTNKSTVRTWLDVYKSFEQPRETSTVVFRCSHTFNKGWQRPLAFRPCDGAYKLAPDMSLVPEHVRNVDYNDLLHMFPPAEREMLMLALGRAVVGHDGQQVQGSLATIKHSWRGYFFIHSNEPQIGKSIFLKTLANVLTQFGYVIADLPPRIGSTFGWHESMVADIIIVDDINEDDQRALMRNKIMKVIASGGFLTTEEKGVKNVPRFQSKATFIGATNTLKEEHYLGLDQGSVSRFNGLGMTPQYQIKDDYSTLIGKWAYIAESNETTLECLMVALLARAKEMFLNLIAKSPEDVTAKYNELRNSYVNKPGLATVQHIVECAEKLTALVISDLMDEDIEPAKEFMKNTGFTGEHLLTVLMASMRALPLGVKTLSRGYARSFEQRYPTLLTNLDHGGKDTFKEIAISVKTDQGWNIPDKAVSYNKDWSPTRVLAECDRLATLDADTLKRLRKMYDTTPIQRLFKNMVMDSPITQL